MKQWYCYIGGKQYGPVAEAILRQWIREGRIGASDLVWNGDMPNWAPAGSVPGLFSPAGQAAPGGFSESMVSVAPRPGTGGRTPNAELTARARATLRGRWGLAIGFCVLYILLGMAASMVPFVGGIVSLIVTGPLMLGYTIFFLTFVRGGEPKLEMLFAGFRNFGSAIAAYLLMAIFIFLWMLLLIVPGIIAGLAYSQTFYVLADNPSVDCLSAIRRSKELMRGHKWKLFCLGLRFIGWSLLCILTLGVGFLWLWPYMAAAYAHFYEDVRPAGEASAGTAASAPPGGLGTGGPE